MKDITEFLKNEVYPRLFDQIGKVFRDRDFKPSKNGWSSPFKLDGGQSHDGRPDKCNITRKVPHRVKEWGGESLSLLDFFGVVHNINTNTSEGFSKALRELCSEIGVEVPKLDNWEQYEANKRKQSVLEKESEVMAKKLFSDDPKAQETLRYLTEVRGYSRDFIEWAGLGFVDEASAKAIAPQLQYTRKDGVEQKLHWSVGRYHNLAIPYRTGGNIKGFVFRSILSFEELSKVSNYRLPKYLDAFVSEYATKQKNLFGLTGLNLSGEGPFDRDLVVVEGELDALHAEFVGVRNVVAASGGELYKEALQGAKNRGVKRIILLYDSEESRDKQEATDKRLQKAMAVAHAEGITPLVCTLPTEEGVKTDVDSFLRNHTGEELLSHIKEAKLAVRYLFEQITETFISKQEAEGKLDDRDIDEYRRQTIGIIIGPYSTPSETSIICKSFEETTGGFIKAEDIQAEAELELEAKNRDRQKEETLDLASEAYRLAKDGKAEEALSLLQDKTSELKRISKETEYGNLLLLPSVDGIKSRFKERPSGVRTGYYLDTQYGKEELVLPSGALTYICAPTSHGKSRMLENLTVQLATDGKDSGSVLYFSFEEDQTAVQLQLLNIYANMTLSPNNLRSLTSNYREDTFQYFDRNTKENHIEEWRRKEAEFMDLLTSGKIRVYYKDYDSSELIEAIRYLARQINVKAVFIDYIQLLHKRGSKLQRKEELKVICKDFMNLSVETQLPIVLAAQLNREAYSPVDMVIQNIAEASDIEHSANTVVLLWNSRVLPIQKNSYYISSTKKDPEGNRVQELGEQAQKLAKKGFYLGVGGKMYIKLAKNRGGCRDIDAVLDFNGNTGRIAPNWSPTEADMKPAEPVQMNIQLQQDDIFSSGGSPF